METHLNERCTEVIKNYSSSVLAYIGDAVLELYVRRRISGDGNVTVSVLNKRALQYVTAVRQSEAVARLLEHLTDMEKEVYKRGRNTKTRSVPKSAGIAEYHKATGLEALFGFLALTEQNERAAELFEKAFPEE